LHGCLIWSCGTGFDNAGVMVRENPEPTARLQTPHEDEDERDRDPDDTQETPLDEPQPPRVEDPPPQPGEKGPYVVSA